MSNQYITINNSKPKDEPPAPLVNAVFTALGVIFLAFTVVIPQMVEALAR